MNKMNVRMFALGIFFSVSLIGSTYFLIEDKAMDTQLSDAKIQLENKGFHVFTEEEYQELQRKQKEDVAKVKAEQAKLETKEKNSSESDPPKEEEDQVRFELKIESGMTTKEISLQLKNAKIIEDDLEFEQFLIENGYNTKVQVGIFELHNKMDYAEMAKIITKS